MAKNKRKAHKKHSRKTTRRARRSCPPGTPVKCKIKEGDGHVVLYCGKMRPILLKAGKGGRFVPLHRAGGKKAKKPRFTAVIDPMAYEVNADY